MARLTPPFKNIDIVVYLWYNKDTIKQGDDFMPQIIPIRDLKNTSQISDICHASNEPVFVTKNGYGDMVIMSIRAPRMLSGEFLFMATPHNSRLTA